MRKKKRKVELIENNPLGTIGRGHLIKHRVLFLISLVI